MPSAKFEFEELADRDVLFLNWKGPDHPEAGGAEAYTWELATRLATSARVTLFTSRHRHSPPSETAQNVKIVRQGGTFSVYLRAAIFMLRNRRKFAAVLDFQNGIPFFASLWFAWSPAAVVLVIHHVHQEQFRHRFGPVLAALGRFLERRATRLVHGTRPVVVVSPSTRAEVRLRLGLRGPIFLVPNGNDRAGIGPARHRETSPSLLYVGRLVAHKRVDVLMESARRLRERWPDLRVHIVGDGPAGPALRRLAESLGLRGTVTFCGRVDTTTREELYREAWLVVLPSEREGWGMTVIEGNSVGVGAVGFPVPGVRDAIRDGETGWLVRPGETLTDTLSRALETLSEDGGFERVAERCRAWAASFGWDASTQRLAGILAAQSRPRRPRGRRLVTDCVTVAEFVPPALMDLETLPLRTSDRRWLDGGRLVLVLHGSDVLHASTVLHRLGAEEGRLRVGLSADLLLGPLPAPEAAVLEAAGGPTDLKVAG